MSNTIQCPKCSCTDYRTIEIRDSAGKKKVKAVCAKCEAYIKFMPLHDSLADFEMPFGKHKGERFADIPKEYLEWASNTFNDGPILKKINEFMYGSER